MKDYKRQLRFLMKWKSEFEDEITNQKEALDELLDKEAELEARKDITSEVLGTNIKCDFDLNLEIKGLSDQIDQLQSKIKEAKKVIEFYSNKNQPWIYIISSKINAINSILNDN